MKQALFAVLSLMLLSFLAFNFQRWKMNSEMNVIRSELLMIATGVASEHLDEIGTMDFEDLEDLQVVDPQPVTVQVDFGSETFDFDVVTDVQYVKKQGNNFVLWQSATDLQKMTVTVSSLTELELLTPTITVSRIYSRSSN